MQNDAAELLQQALKLPPSSRAQLADSLIESLDEVVDGDASETWASEIARRAQELDSGVVATVPWEEVQKRLKNRFPG